MKNDFVPCVSYTLVKEHVRSPFECRRNVPDISPSFLLKNKSLRVLPVATT